MRGRQRFHLRHPAFRQMTAGQQEPLRGRFLGSSPAFIPSKHDVAQRGSLGFSASEAPEHPAPAAPPSSPLPPNTLSMPPSLRHPSLAERVKAPPPPPARQVFLPIPYLPPLFILMLCNERKGVKKSPAKARDHPIKAGIRRPFPSTVFRIPDKSDTGGWPFFLYWQWKKRWSHPPPSPPPTGSPAFSPPDTFRGT